MKGGRLLPEHRCALVGAWRGQKVACSERIVRDLFSFGLVMVSIRHADEYELTLTPDGITTARLCYRLRRWELWEHCASELLDRVLKTADPVRRRQLSARAALARARAEQAWRRVYPRSRVQA